jgi:hypothetical protein
MRFRREEAETLLLLPSLRDLIALCASAVRGAFCLVGLNSQTPSKPEP